MKPTKGIYFSYYGTIKIRINKIYYIKESDYLHLIENAMIVEALKIAGIEKMSIYQAMRRILDDKRVEIHVKPLCSRYSFDKSIK